MVCASLVAAQGMGQVRAQSLCDQLKGVGSCCSIWHHNKPTLHNRSTTGIARWSVQLALEGPLALFAQSSDAACAVHVLGAAVTDTECVAGCCCRWLGQARLQYRTLVAERAEKQQKADAAVLHAIHAKEAAELR